MVVSKLVATITQCDQVLFGVVSEMASKVQMVDLQILGVIHNSGIAKRPA